MKNFLGILFFGFFAFNSVQIFGFVLHRTNKEELGIADALVYLNKFGYIEGNVNPNAGALISAESFEQSVKEFQAFAGLNQTGILDEETKLMMSMPRCGVKDKVGSGSTARRKKRYALQGSRWKVRDLTFAVTKYPLYLTRQEVDRDVAKAFKVWEEVTDLNFNSNGASPSKIHIDIRFESGEHGDGDPFDGPGGTLAHAYFPIYGGDVHFDSSETWTVQSYRGTNLFQVAAHEFGHSLGLSHSDNQNALMAPFYRGYQNNFKLNQDDIKGIQKLYGKKRTVSTSTTSKPGLRDGPQSSDDPLCADPSIDTIVTMADQKTYVFKGDYYYKLTNEGIDNGYPRNISSDFEGLPGNLDAAFTWTNGKTYFFKGNSYWRLTDLAIDPSYPKLISKGFSGIPNDLDVAFVWSGNGKIYFMKGDKYWRFDPAKRPPVAVSYPKLISAWEGIPNSLEGALQYSNGYTYFFKNGKYFRFNDRAFRMDNADPPFPRPAGYWWFGCPDKQSLQSLGKHIIGDEEGLPLTGADDVTGEDTFDAEK